MPTDHNDHNDRNKSSDSSANRTGRDASEPRSEDIKGRSLSGASYGATEREQTRDLRLPDPADPTDPDNAAATSNQSDTAKDDIGE